MKTNKKVTVQVIIGCLMLFSVTNTVFGQEYNSVESLVRARLRRGFANPWISDTSPKADELVRYLTHGDFPDDKVLIRYFFESEKPISSAQYRLLMSDVSLELAGALTGIVEAETYSQLSSLEPNTVAEVKKAIGVVVTRAIVQGKRTEFEIHFSAEHPDGREIFGIFGFYSAPKPVVDIERIITQTDGPANQRVPSVVESSTIMTGSEITSTIKNVDEVLLNDPRLREILERMERSRD
jgi:hypothetical protein